MKATLALAAVTALGIPSAQAAPFALAPVASQVSVIEVSGGCGWGWYPVPGHWSYWRGYWVPPHCVPDQYWGAPSGGSYGYGYGNGYWNGGGGRGNGRHDEDDDRD